jgi:hypothetical protein
MVRQLFVLWRDQNRTRHVIGLLSKGVDGFTFAYDEGVSEAQSLGFRLLPQFPELRAQGEPYSSRYLFSTFLQRIPSPSRPDYLAAMKELGVADFDDPLEILARSGGVLMTDRIELAEYRAEYDGLSTPLTFRVAGERFNPGGEVSAGDAVELAREPENPHDPNATFVLCGRGQKIGYVPRYYARMLAMVLDGGGEIRGTFERRIRTPEELRWVVRIWKE